MRIALFRQGLNLSENISIHKSMLILLYKQTMCSPLHAVLQEARKAVGREVKC